MSNDCFSDQPEDEDICCFSQQADEQPSMDLYDSLENYFNQSTCSFHRQREYVWNLYGLEGFQHAQGSLDYLERKYFEMDIRKQAYCHLSNNRHNSNDRNLSGDSKKRISQITVGSQHNFFSGKPNKYKKNRQKQRPQSMGDISIQLLIDEQKHNLMNLQTTAPRLPSQTRIKTPNSELVLSPQQQLMPVVSKVELIFSAIVGAKSNIVSVHTKTATQAPAAKNVQLEASDVSQSIYKQLAQVEYLPIQTDQICKSKIFFPTNNYSQYPITYPAQTIFKKLFGSRKNSTQVQQASPNIAKVVSTCVDGIQLQQSSQCVKFNSTKKRQITQTSQGFESIDFRQYLPDQLGNSLQPQEKARVRTLIQLMKQAQVSKSTLQNNEIMTIGKTKVQGLISLKQEAEREKQSRTKNSEGENFNFL